MKKKNRPETVDVRPKGVMFSQTGSTGWNRIRNIHDQKEGKKEGDFSDQHHKFWSEGDDPVE
jgi:hypothetical protein